MKTLFFGIVLILLIGVGGFVYRNVSERPMNPTACTLEAKICPDGSSVGRVNPPQCTFAPCPAPNVEFADAAIAFALPAGYAKGVQEPGADGELPGMLDFFEKKTASSTNTITVYRYMIPEGKTANDVILEQTEFSPSGQKPETLEKFSPVFVNGKTFQAVTFERFEGQVATSYYLSREKDVVRFDVIERGVEKWTDPSLVIDNLPEHKALLKMLGTLQTN